MWNADPCQQWDFMFLKKRGVPLSVSMGVLNTPEFEGYLKPKTLTKNYPKCRRVCFKIVGHEWDRCPTILKQSRRLVTQLFIELSHNFDSLVEPQSILNLNDLRWISVILEFFRSPKMTVPLFWYSSNLKSNVTWRIPERRLSRYTQTTFFGSKRVYILGRF